MARWVTKALAVAPGLVVSTAVVVMVGAVLPPLAGAVLFWGGLTITVLLALGRLERAAARVLHVSRPARPGEREDLAPALTLLCRAGLGPPLVEIRVRGGVSAVTAGAMGRRTVIVSSGLVDTVADEVLPPEQAAAVIAHAASLVRGGWLRSDAVIAFWGLPWQLIRAAAEAVAQAGRQLPFMALAWRLRALVVCIAVVQAFQQGEPLLALRIALIGALSSAMPVWERRWQESLIEAGDRALDRLGLAPAMVEFLRRCPSSDVVRERLRNFDGAPRHPAPIGLVAR